MFRFVSSATDFAWKYCNLREIIKFQLQNMDRFSWSDGLLAPDENLIVQQQNVRIYDGEDKVWKRV